MTVAYETETFSERVLRTTGKKIRAHHVAKRNFDANDLNAGDLVNVGGTLYQFNFIDVDDSVSLTDEYGRGYRQNIDALEISGERVDGMFTDYKIQS